ncbi:MAG: ABC transporter substrate-binding protein [Candidatus Schekmanbacteria bacterium]|nr:MAG: ABC transporter substrate-binding protein [Candidatus Schekmanbacteria bacterium]
MIKNTKLFFYILISFLISLSIFSCNKKSSVKKDYLIVAFESAPITMDPRLATDVQSSRLTELLFNGLVKFDKNLRIVPDLCKNWEMINDKTFRFYLREGVKFHSGEILTADDVVYTFKTVMSENLKSPLRGAYDFLDHIEAVDSHTVDFYLSYPYAPFLTAMTLGIVPKRYAEKVGEKFGEMPSGTGPFVFDSMKREREIKLKANPDYFEEGTPKIDGIIVKIIRDESVRALQMENGDINFCENAFSPDTLERFRRNKNLIVLKDKGTDYYYLGINMRDPILRNLAVRRAIAYGIDRSSIIKNFEKNNVIIAKGLLPKDHWAYEDDVNVYEYNPLLAKKLLDEAGFTDPDGDGPKMRFNLTYKTTFEERSRKFAEIFQEQMRKIGIGINIKMYEWATFYNDIKEGNFQLFRLKWVGVTDPDHYYEIFNSKRIPPVGKNRGFYSNPEIDRLTEEGRRTFDLKKRKTIYSKIQKIVAKELPYISLWHGMNNAVLTKNVKGFLLFPRGEFESLKNVYFVKEKNFN